MRWRDIRLYHLLTVLSRKKKCRPCLLSRLIKNWSVKVNFAPKSDDHMNLLSKGRSVIVIFACLMTAKCYLVHDKELLSSSCQHIVKRFKCRDSFYQIIGTIPKSSMYKDICVVGCRNSFDFLHFLECRWLCEIKKKTKIVIIIIMMMVFAKKQKKTEIVHECLRVYKGVKFQ